MPSFEVSKLSNFTVRLPSRNTTVYRKTAHAEHALSIFRDCRTHPETYRNPKIRGIRGKNGADEGGVADYSDRG